MKYRRPQDFDSAIQQLSACSMFQVTGRKRELQNAVARLFELNWYNDAMKPLYNSNVVVQLVMNSIVPMIQELIFDQTVFDKHIENQEKAKVERYRAEYTTLLDKMKRVAPLRKQRAVTVEFETMAAAMERYANDDAVQKALCDVFCAIKTARTAFRLVFGRINDALENHNEILKSDDIPFEALSM